MWEKVNTAFTFCAILVVSTRHFLTGVIIDWYGLWSQADLVYDVGYTILIVALLWASFLLSFHSSFFLFFSFLFLSFLFFLKFTHSVSHSVFQEIFNENQQIFNENSDTLFCVKNSTTKKTDKNPCSQEVYLLEWGDNKVNKLCSILDHDKSYGNSKASKGTWGVEKLITK